MLQNITVDRSRDLGYYKIMQTKLASSIIQFAKVSLGVMKKPSEPINKERGKHEYKK